MTYKDLGEYIKNLSPDQLNQDVTVYVCGTDEYYPLLNEHPVMEADADDVLNIASPYLVI